MRIETTKSASAAYKAYLNGYAVTINCKPFEPSTFIRQFGDGSFVCNKELGNFAANHTDSEVKTHFDNMAGMSTATGCNCKFIIIDFYNND